MCFIRNRIVEGRAHMGIKSSHSAMTTARNESPGGGCQLGGMILRSECLPCLRSVAFVIELRDWNSAFFITVCRRWSTRGTVNDEVEVMHGQIGYIPAHEVNEVK